jgi:DNA-binding MarR family transcriptional regulator
MRRCKAYSCMIQLSRQSQDHPESELDQILIDDIRAASRQMVRELGFMDATIAATDYPPTAVHAILEIGMHGPMTSGQLADVLRLEKSSISRMVRKLIDGGELKENPDAGDARAKPLSLTPKGRRTLVALHDFGRRQVSGALGQLTEAERRSVRDGLMLYARALRANRAEKAEAAVA